jgi:hypothetical protein
VPIAVQEGCQPSVCDCERLDSGKTIRDSTNWTNLKIAAAGHRQAIVCA